MNNAEKRIRNMTVHRLESAIAALKSAAESMDFVSEKVAKEILDLAEMTRQILARTANQ